jgi:hypothetical protein
MTESTKSADHSKRADKCYIPHCEVCALQRRLKPGKAPKPKMIPVAKGQLALPLEYKEPQRAR